MPEQFYQGPESVLNQIPVQPNQFILKTADEASEDDEIIDLNGMLQADNLKLSKVNKDGTITALDLNDPEGATIDIDIKSMMAAEGMNPAKVAFEFNKPETAVDESAVTFGTAYRLATAATMEDKIKILNQDYGKNNINLDEEAGEITIKQDGIWKKADTSFMQEMTNMTPEVIGGIVGTVIGATAGSLVAPGLGSVALGIGGRIVGGAIGSALATMGKNEIAEQYGIRTEQDAAVVKDLLVKDAMDNMLWDTVLMAGMPAGAKLLKLSVNKTENIFNSFLDKEFIAASLGKFSGLDKKVFDPVVRNVESGKNTLKFLNREVEYEQALSKGTTTSVQSPSEKLSIDLVSRKLGQWKDKAYMQYSEMLENVKPVMDRVKVDLGDVKQSYKNLLVNDFKLISSDTGKETGKDIAGELAEIFGTNESKKLLKVNKILSKVGDEGIKFGDLKQVLNTLDDIIAGSGYYKGGDKAIGSQARRALKTLRANIDDKLSTSLKGHNIKVNGQVVDAGNHYKNQKTIYSNFRNSYDDFGSGWSSKRGDQRMYQTIQKMLGKNGSDIETNFLGIANSVGDDAIKTIGTLQQLRSAKALSPYYRGVAGEGASIAAQGAQWMFPQIFTPRGAAKTANAWARLTEPATATMSKTKPITQAAFEGLKTTAKTIKFFKDLAPTDRFKLLTTPELFREFIGTAYETPNQVNMLEQQIYQQGMGQ